MNIKNRHRCILQAHRFAQRPGHQKAPQAKLSPLFRFHVVLPQAIIGKEKPGEPDVDPPGAQTRAPAASCPPGGLRAGIHCSKLTSPLLCRPAPTRIKQTPSTIPFFAASLCSCLRHPEPWKSNSIRSETKAIEMSRLRIIWFILAVVASLTTVLGLEQCAVSTPSCSAHHTFAFRKPTFSMDKLGRLLLLLRQLWQQRGQLQRHRHGVPVPRQELQRLHAVLPV